MNTYYMPETWEGAICISSGMDGQGPCSAHGRLSNPLPCTCRKNPSTPWVKGEHTIYVEDYTWDTSDA